MPALSLLIKPASGKCNLHCDYCFYMDEIRHRQIEDYGNMSEQTVRNLIEKAFSYGTHTVMFGFQGGEPTLMGLDFFRAFCKLVKEQKPKQLQTVFTLQTNGTLLTPEWTAFFKENNFLVGLSLDGPRSIHNLYRKDQNGDGTFKAVLHAAKLLKEAKVDFNILATKSGDINMRIMLDTNILVSAIFFPSVQTRKLVRELSENHRIILCDYVIKKIG